MILYFQAEHPLFYVISYSEKLTDQTIEKLRWLFGNASFVDKIRLEGFFIGPRSEMITPWSTNAVEITQNMGINGITRIEKFFAAENDKVSYDKMLQQL